jgi:outer membrane receptor for ferrienterochelin and colicin
MKRIILLLAIIFSVTAVKAQFGVGGGSTTVGKVSGTIIDSLTKKPLDYATVAIYRATGNSPINGVVTDEKGNFRIDNVKPGQYKLGVSFIGYPTKMITGIITTDSKPDKNAGTIYIAPAANKLKEVVVTGAAAMVENKIDKLVYNAEKDITAAGGNATDVLQKVPLVSLDMNGNVALRGDQNVKVLINGKPSGAAAASVSDLLKTIPADQIKSVEVITSPSAKYDAEGSGGIINIITKTKSTSGVSGSVSGGVGTRQNNGNANFNYNRNRFSLSANIGGNSTWPQTTHTDVDQVAKSAATATQPAVDVHNVNTNASEMRRHGLMGSVTAGYEFNAFNSLNSTIRITDGKFDFTGNGTNTRTDNLNPALSGAYTSSNMNKNKFQGFDWNVDYTHKFHKTGHELVISGQWSHSTIKTDYQNLYSAVNPSQKGNNDGKNNEYTAQLDYTLPISNLLKLEAGGKTIQRRINSIYNIYNTDPNGNNAIFDTNNSNLYDYTQNVYAGYSVLTFTLPKSYAVLLGGRFENTAITGDPQNPYQTTSSASYQVLNPFTANYNTYIPSLTVQKVFGANTLKASYSKRIQRPSLQVLNPFINRSQAQSQTVGNPNLSPETSQTYELNYNAFIKSSVVNFSVYYKKTDNMIESINSTINETINGQQIQGTRGTTNNVAVNNSFGASFFGSINPIKILTIRGSVNVFTYNPTVYAQYTSYINPDALKTSLMSTAMGSLQLNLPKNLVMEGFGFANSARRTIQGTSPAFGIYGLGIKKQFADKKASIGFNTIQPFAVNKSFDQNVSSSTFKTTSHTLVPFQSFGITFSYSFGKMNFGPTNPMQKKKGVNNDDLIQGGDQQGGGGGGAPARN